MKYFYKTVFGTFFIIPEEHGYTLWIEEHDEPKDRLGWYSTAAFAADAVAHLDTGFDNWDLQENEVEYFDLEEWTKFQ